jgi:hypothetical protein
VITSVIFCKNGCEDRKASLSYHLRIVTGITKGDGGWLARRKKIAGLLTIVQGEKANGDDPIRGSMRRMLEEVLEKEMTAFLNAEPDSRAKERRGYRNGYKPRTLVTRAGRIEWLERKYLEMNAVEMMENAPRFPHSHAAATASS